MKTVSQSCRIPLKPLATIALYYLEHGIVIRTRSQLVAQIVKDFSSLVVDNKKVAEITDDEVAIGLINRLFGTVSSKANLELMSKINLSAASSAPAYDIEAIRAQVEASLKNHSENE